MGGYIPPNNLAVSPNNLNGCTSERKLGKETVLFLVKTFFFWSSPEFGGKSVPFAFFFFGLHYISKPEQNRGRGSSPPMLKIGQNFGKLAIIPPNAQQRSAPLVT